MFRLFKKKPTTGSLYAVAAGEMLSLSELDEPVFSQRMIGDGYAVLPDDGRIFAPVSGTVINIFESQHAVGFKMENGLEILLHMGIDTAGLKGAPFKLQVREGDKVNSTTRIAEVDLAQIRQEGKETTMVVVLTNMAQVEHLLIEVHGHVEPGEEIGVATAVE
ncbi:PTS sugar transporter subunit IIA [Enterococcus canis]|uniref:PTS sugar transporter subunit IIA n=1 Tax=Enterococcus canis TaxID=214095 RepID=UPI000A6C323B